MTVQILLVQFFRWTNILALSNEAKFSTLSSSIFYDSERASNYSALQTTNCVAICVHPEMFNWSHLNLKWILIDRFGLTFMAQLRKFPSGLMKWLKWRNFTFKFKPRTKHVVEVKNKQTGISRRVLSNSFSQQLTWTSTCNLNIKLKNKYSNPSERQNNYIERHVYE